MILFQLWFYCLIDHSSPTEPYIQYKDNIVMPQRLSFLDPTFHVFVY